MSLCCEIPLYFLSWWQYKGRGIFFNLWIFHHFLSQLHWSPRWKVESLRGHSGSNLAGVHILLYSIQNGKKNFNLHILLLVCAILTKEIGLFTFFCILRHDFLLYLDRCINIYATKLTWNVITTFILIFLPVIYCMIYSYMKK